MSLSANVVAELQRLPLLTVAEMSSALDAERAAHGMYAWWLVNSDALPTVPTTTHPSEPVGLLYVGVGPSSVRSKRKLRDRFRDHTRTNTGSSTFRLVLASFLFEREGWRPYWTDRPMLSKADNDALSEWQAASLRAQWVEVTEPWQTEPDVIGAMRPPLNREHNEAHPFYDTVGDSRDGFRAAARANTDAPS